ncbi:hypothetical protein, partial [Novosphingobium soli]
TWPPLAAAAQRLRAALLAPRDIDQDHAHAELHATLAEARSLMDGPGEPSPLPSAVLQDIGNRMGRSARFAPPERSVAPVALGRRVAALERRGLPSPHWAVEALLGERLRRDGFLPCALPCPGLIRTDALRTPDPGEARALGQQALNAFARGTHDKLVEATALLCAIREGTRTLRGRSRVPALWQLLGSFGPLRSAQLEVLLGATRLGIRSMLAVLDDLGILQRTTISGSHLYSVRTPGTLPALVREDAPAFSADALDEYEASLAQLDRLLGMARPINSLD